MTEQEIRDLFAGFNVALPKEDIWRVQGNPVVKHQALERLAAAMKVEWTEVQFIHITDKSAVIMVRGKRTDGIIAHEWSTGEAVIGQNYQVSGKQAAYPVAMAEKRAKDRVILKLARLYGVYSEDEADEFKAAAPSNNPPRSNAPEQRQPTLAEEAREKAEEGMRSYTAWFMALSKADKAALVDGGYHAHNKTIALNVDSEAA